jgi:heptosyltransferase-2
MEKLNVLVMATTTPEAFGRVIIEAGASGVPVVATSVGGVVDILQDKKTGLLVPAKDYIKMAGAVVSLWKDKKLAIFLANNFRKKVEADFSLNQMIDKTIKVYEEVFNSPNILVIKISAAGDVVLAIPSLKAMRDRFPQADIWVLTSPATRELLEGCVYINHIIVYDKKRKDRGLLGIWRLGQNLRRLNFDLIVDLQNNKTSHLLSFLSGAFKRYGYNNKKLSFLLNYKIKDEKEPISPLQHQLKVLKLLGIEQIEEKLELWPSSEDEEYINHFLAKQWIGEQQVLIGFNIGSSKKWNSKRWPIENWAKFCDELSLKYSWRIVITGHKDDLILVDELMKLTKAKPIIAVGQTSLRQLAALIKKCQVYLSSDSAPLHIALSMSVPSVAFFGATDSKRHTFSDSNLTVLEKKLKCQPCYKPQCHSLECLRQISVKEVVEIAEKIIK